MYFLLYSSSNINPTPGRGSAPRTGRGYVMNHAKNSAFAGRGCVTPGAGLRLGVGFMLLELYM